MLPLVRFTRRRPAWCLLLCLIVASAANAQPLTRQNLANILGFENNSRPDVLPAGWSATPANTIFTDNQIVHSGNYSARIERDASSSATFSTITVSIPLDFAGRTIEWRGFLKWEDVNGFVALWLREDGDTPNLAFATLQQLNLNGSRDWTPYSISVTAMPAGRQLVFGFLLSGTGKGWVDDLQLLVDGVPVAQAAPRIPTVLESDHDFDQGSRVNITGLSDVQIKNLATLAKVWGFVKYHHPAVTGGLHHWDYELFRILPEILAAPDTAASTAAVSDWLKRLGALEECAPCANLDSSNLYLSPNVGWIRDESLLGRDLSQALQTIYRNRKPAARQFYVSLAAGVGNPVFENELSYGTIKFPDSGYQLLALFRFWNMVQYFYPNRDIMADDTVRQPNYWDTVLEESIPRIAVASDTLSYQQELIRFIAKINDTHANLWSSLAARPPIGSCQLPVDVRLVEGRPIVLRYNSATAGPASGLMAGDLIEQLDGVAVDDLLNQWRPLYADSNEAARLRDIGQAMTRGPCGAATVVVRRGESHLSLQSGRVPISSLNLTASFTHDRPGDAFQKLADDIGYLKLSSVKAADSASYIRSAAGTKGLIIDIRNYPSEFVVFTLGQLLVSEPTQFVRFTAGDITNPGAFRWNPPLSLTPQEPHYSGKVAILIDEVTQSQAEYTTMAFRAAPGAIVIGSTTAGADGNVSLVALPGGFSSNISGLGVFYPDNRPTQRVGIVPDIVVRPTIDGIRAGRDELIEEAIRQIKAATAPSINFSLKNGAVATLPTYGSASTPSVGYGTIQRDSGSTGSGVAISGFRENQILISEAAIPATSLMQNGRTYAEISATVNTGLAIANPNNQAATISFYFTDSTANFGHGSTTIAAKGQIAAFLNQPPFHGRSPLSGTFTFTSSLPVATAALRRLTNERGEFLMTTLPVADLNAPLSTAALVFPQFAEGGGWTTQIVLLNPTDTILTGTVRLLDPPGTTTGDSFAYSIPPRTSHKLQTPGTGGSAVVRSLRVVPAGGAAPFGLAIFSFRNGATAVSEAAVPAAPAGNVFRVYAEASGDFKTHAIGSVQTGLAVTNTSSNTATLMLELFNLDGSAAGRAGTLSIPANGQLTSFLDQIAELAPLQTPFQGTLRVSSPASISVTGFRGRYNERGDFLITAIPAMNEASPPASSPLFFPHLVASGGYNTQLILFGARPEQAFSGTLSLFTQAGTPVNLTFR
jgi:C-terminal processing protease CtpA/Prc